MRNGARVFMLLSALAAAVLAQQPAPTGVPAAPPLLTRQDAEKLALENNPRVKASALLARVQTQVVRERRADQLPDLSGNVTGVAANQPSRISTGSLAASRLLDHAGAGVQLNQLITDFGRTGNLIASARLQEKAKNADALATREDIILATDQAFYDALESQATLQVAKQTVDARQALTDQVSAYTSAKLKSDLDLGFVQVNLSQAKLLLLNAQNNFDAAKAALSAVLGFDHVVDYQLVDASGDLPKLPPGADESIKEALNQRPDLASLRYSAQAARKFSRAQSDQQRPSISALGVVGYTPWGALQDFNADWYGAVGVNINFPIFNGFRFKAQAAEADLQASAGQEHARDLANRIARDVRTAWLTANTELQRVSLTAELLKQANLSLDLAQTRYKLGLSSVVELSQAQLQQTQAAIDNVNARIQFEAAYANLLFETGVTQ